MEREQEVREIAYQIWEEEGHTQGQNLEHWLKAEARWESEHNNGSALEEKTASTLKTVKKVGTPAKRR